MHFSLKSQLSIVTALLGLSGIFGVGLRAQTVVYNNFATTTGLTLNDAVAVDGAMLLAAGNQDKRGAFFHSTQLNATQFSTVFTFQISSPGGTSDGIAAGADGIAFVIQNSSVTALGGSGEGMGYGPRGGTSGIGSSVAVEFDTFKNSWDPSSNHIGIDANGNLTSLAATPVATAFDNGSVWTAWVDYNGTTLEVRASNTGVRPTSATLSYNISLGSNLDSSTAWFGFTGATGSAYGEHQVLSWSYSPTYSPSGFEAVPEPSTYALLAAGTGLLALRRWKRRR